MAFKLTKEEMKQYDTLLGELRAQWELVDAAVQGYNGAIEAAKVDVETVVAAYNELIVQAQDFADQVTVRLEDEYDEKSVKWQESDPGQAASSMKDDWQSLQMDAIAFDFPDALDLPWSGINDFENLPVEPS